MPGIFVIARDGRGSLVHVSRRLATRVIVGNGRLPVLTVSTSDAPKNSLVHQDTHGRVRDGQDRGADEPPFEAHHISENERHWPTDGGRDKREPPPSAERQAEQNEGWDHRCPFWHVDRTAYRDVGDKRR